MLVILWSNYTYSLPKPGEDELQRKPVNVRDLQKNTISSIDFYNTNYGIIGHNAATTRGGLFWPRGTSNQYLFASGFWFGAQKMKPDKSEMYKYVTISYNPNSGISWLVPGIIREEQDNVDASKLYMHRIYYSTDFNEATGQAYDKSDGPAWPLWKNSDTQQLCEYSENDFEYDTNSRNTNRYPLGHLVISDEDMFCTYKDTDLSSYEGGALARRALGYPLRLQVYQRVLTWNSDHTLKDCAIVQYLLTNESQDTLKNCYFAPLYDIDIGLTSEQAKNDRLRYYDYDKSLNLAVGWTNTNLGELGSGYGYIGVSLIETPAIDDEGYIKKGLSYYPSDQQLGISTFKNWPIEEDRALDNERYDFISSHIIDGDTGPGDKRLMFSTGPFHLLPKETIRVAVLIAFAMPCKGGEADGTTEDISCVNGLEGKAKRAISYYYSPKTSVDENANPIINLAIHPNPASEYIEISSPFINPTVNRGVDESSEIKIFNTLGECVISVETRHAVSLQRIDISHLPRGVYYLRIGNRTQMFVKM
jgi:hypothetical protein